MRFSGLCKTEGDDKAMCTFILSNFMAITCFESLLITGEYNQMALFLVFFFSFFGFFIS